MGIETYREVQAKVEGGRAEDYRRLAELTRDLLRAQKDTGDVALWASAVYRNQQFWSRLRLSMLQATASLPDALRLQFFSLAEWVEKESVRASVGEVDLDHLIAVNKQIMEGLRDYGDALASHAIDA